jgi:hypothetical protein
MPLEDALQLRDRQWIGVEVRKKADSKPMLSTQLCTSRAYWRMDM